MTRGSSLINLKVFSERRHYTGIVSGVERFARYGDFCNILVDNG